MTAGIFDPAALPLASTECIASAEFPVEDEVGADDASELSASEEEAPSIEDVRAAFLAVVSKAPARVLAQRLDKGLVRKLNELYPSSAAQTAFARIAEECGAHGLMATEFFGFVIKHRPSAQSLVRFTNAVMARSPASRVALIESIHRKREEGFYYGLVKDLDAHPAFDDFKNVHDVELFHVISSRSSLPREDLAIFDTLRTHGVAKIRRYYREGLKSIPPIRVTVDSHLLEWDRRFKGSALCAMGRHPLYEERPGTNLSPHHVMMGLQWPVAARDCSEPTIFEANLLVFFARQRTRPGWSDIMSAIVKIAREEDESKRERILNLLPDLILDGSVDDFIASVKALAERGDDAVFEFVEKRKGSIAALNRSLDTALFFKQERMELDWNALASAPEGVIENAYALRLQRHRERYPEKPIDQVRSEFLGVTNGPAVPEAELGAALATYEKILALESGIVALSKDELSERITRVRERGAPDHVELLALARDAARREFGIYPYNTQMLTAILLLASPERYPKGRVAQVATGEGKSLVFAMLAACIASQGTGVDLFTSNNYLAHRDARTFAPFYRWFGLSTHAFRHRDWQVAESRSADVRYGPCAEFRWAEMMAAVEGKRLFDKPASVGLVDEVDNLLIDEGSTPAVISASTASFLPAQIFEAVYGYVLQVDDRKMPQDLSRLKKSIHEIHAAHAAPDGPRRRNPRAMERDLANERIRKNLEALTDEALLFLVEQARKARGLARNRDYVVVGDGPYDTGWRREVVIVDRENTGRIKEGHVWENGLHRFVELKEFGHCADEDVTSFSSSAQVFYRGYGRLYALTGTIGDRVDRHELENKYGLAGFTVPTHQPCRRVDHPLTVVATDAERDKMAARLYPRASRGRGGNSAPPALFMFGSIEEAMAHYDRKLRSSHVDGIQVVTGEFKKNENRSPHDWQREIFPVSEDQAVAQAGRAGMLTIATPIFGRGTDIVPSEEAIAAGGLTCVQMFLPKNLRVEVQGRGRAGRQGKPGASFVIASLESEATLRRMSAVTERLAGIYGPKWYVGPEALAFFHLLRGAENVIDLLEKDVRLALDERHHAYQSRYFDAMSRAKTGLEHVHRKGKPLRDGRIVMFGGKIFSHIRKVNEVLTEANERWAHAYTLYNLLSEAVRAPDDLAPLEPPNDDYRRLFDEIASSAAASGMNGHALAQAKEAFSERLRAQYARASYRMQRSVELLDALVGNALKEIENLLGSA